MDLKRRKFVANSTGILVAAGLGSSAVTSEAVNPPNKKMNVFIHHVFFTLVDNTDENRSKIMEGLKKLSKIKSVVSYHIGIPADTNRDVVNKDYSMSWCVHFHNAQGEEKYQVDPIHLKFIEDYKHLWNKVVVFDSETVKF
jgi:hypothetical protein